MGGDLGATHFAGEYRDRAGGADREPAAPHDPARMASVQDPLQAGVLAGATHAGEPPAVLGPAGTGSTRVGENSNLEGWAGGSTPADGGRHSWVAEAWPEIRFYLGSFGLFFVAYTLITALLVGLGVVALHLHSVAITSGSMEPLIQAGDVVLFAEPPAPGEEPLLPGAVVGFHERGSGRAITHRVVSLDRDGAYVTRGDANPSPDPQVVAPEQLWGVGRMLVPYAGYPAAWLAVGQVWKVVALSGFLLGCAYASRWALLDEFNPWSEA